MDTCIGEGAVGLMTRASKGGVQQGGGSFSMTYQAPHSMLHVLICTQTQPTPNILRTHATSYTELGIALGYFICDFIVCLKYDVRWGPIRGVGTALLGGPIRGVGTALLGGPIRGVGYGTS